MTYQILQSKLHRPELTSLPVAREEIDRKFQANPQAGIILVSSFAGSGKSTMISDWLLRGNYRHVWYSLDAWDNDLQLFFAYLIEGIKGLDPLAAGDLLQLLESFQSIGYHAFIRSLITRLHRMDQEFVFVLDDYYLIDNDELHTFIKLLMAHLPPKMKLVMITREDPPFPLAKYRVSNQLLEFRLADLRFSREEVGIFLAHQLRQDIDEEQTSLLAQRTEGWVAGLQLAVLSMQGSADIGGFIKEFSGSHIYIMDYLIEEVLEKQPAEIKVFLLKTSILEYLSADLCDACLGEISGYSKRMIADLMRHNLFVIPLDREDKWYRYHHLFRDLLRQRLPQYLQRVGSITLAELHSRAGDWYKAKGMAMEAIHHYLDGQANDQAAALIECQWAEMDVNMQSSSWLAMARLLPEGIIEKRPVLAMGYGWALIDTGDIEESKIWLGRAEKLAEQHLQQPAEFPVADWKQFALLPATISVAYAYIAAAEEDIAGVFCHAQVALDKTPGDQYYKRGVIAMLLAFAHWSSGDLLAAEKIIADNLRQTSRMVNDLTSNSFQMVLGELYLQMGRLPEAKSLYEKTIRQVDGAHKVPSLLASLYLGLANVAYLAGNSQEAYALLKKSREYGENCSIMDWQYKYYLLDAQLYASEGLFDLALESMEESRRTYFANPIPDYIPLEEMALYIQMKKDGLPGSVDIVRTESLTTQPIPYLAEFGAGLSVQQMLGQKADAAMLKKADIICNKLIENAKRQNRQGHRINYLVLASQVKKAVGSPHTAQILLDEAASLAKQDNCYRPFLDHLPPAEGLKYAKKEALQLKQEMANQRLVEPLTIREMEVLGLIVTGLSNQEITNRLFLALSTVKGYNQNIYAKLAVKRRTEAVAKARDLGLV